MPARKAAAKPSAAAKPKATTADDPDKLKRQSAGEYATADGRFTVRSDGGRWFLVDTERTDELGQPLVRGPWATLEHVREQLPFARRTQAKAMAAPAPPPTDRPTKGGRTAPTEATPAGAKPKPKAKPTSWIDRLPAAESARVRAVVRALEREGIADADALARRDLEGMAPAIVERLIERQLADLVAALPPKDRTAAQRLVRRAAAVVAGTGAPRVAGLPGWQVVEVGAEPANKSRRVTLLD